MLFFYPEVKVFSVRKGKLWSGTLIYVQNTEQRKEQFFPRKHLPQDAEIKVKRILEQGKAGL